MVGAARRVAPLPDAVGAELVGGFADTHRLSPPPPALCVRLAQRPGLQLLPVPPAGWRDGRRHRPQQCPPRRGRERQPRLLDRRALCPARLYEPRPRLGAQLPFRPPPIPSAPARLPPP